MWVSYLTSLLVSFQMWIKKGNKIYLRGMLQGLNEVKHVEDVQCNHAIVMYLYKPAMNDHVDWALYDSKECRSHVVGTV